MNKNFHVMFKKSNWIVKAYILTKKTLSLRCVIKMVSSFVTTIQLCSYKTIYLELGQYYLISAHVDTPCFFNDQDKNQSKTNIISFQASVCFNFIKFISSYLKCLLSHREHYFRYLMHVLMQLKILIKLFSILRIQRQLLQQF